MGRRRKIIEEEQEEDIVEENWDIKKVLIGFATIALFAMGVYYYIAHQLTPEKTAQVLGTFIQNDPQYEKHKQQLINSSQKDAGKLIEKVKEDVGKITTDNLGNSSEDIQGIIDNLQALQGKTKEPADVVCDYICKK
jgi:predicted PurR-regulated permease PerM